MAREYKELSKLTLDEQEDILRTMSQSYYPIEINDKVFMIPEEVNNLIDRLVERLEKNPDVCPDVEDSERALQETLDKFMMEELFKHTNSIIGEV